MQFYVFLRTFATELTTNKYYNMKKQFIIFLILCIGGISQAQITPSATRYDYSNVSQTLAGKATTKLEQVRCIYNWICENIKYDTSYSIYTADECFDNRRGVCQAYCELFYRICEPLDIKCLIIDGKSKDAYGNVGLTNHSWLYVEVDDGSILIDPTWGAGSINNGRFERSTDPSVWFQINPYWLIFTHFPTNELFQFLEEPIDFATFCKLPPLKPECKYFGWKGKEMFDKCISGEYTKLPQILSLNKNLTLRLKEVPMHKDLNPATKYHFEVENPNNLNFGIHIDGIMHDSSGWTKSGDTYSIDFMPGAGGEMLLMVEQAHNQYTALLGYRVSQPTAKEAEYIRKNQAPIISALDFNAIELVEYPQHRLLNPATTYRFVVKNPHSKHFGIQVNSTFYGLEQWIKSADNTFTLDIMPSQAGKLVVLVSKYNNSTYTQMMEYEVAQPTNEEKEYIRTHMPPTFYCISNNLFTINGIEGTETLNFINIPPYKDLNPATTYRFEVENPLNLPIGLSINGKRHPLSEWERKGDKYSIDIMPGEGGNLAIVIMLNAYSMMDIVQYDVADPTEDEQKAIQQQKQSQLKQPLYLD